MTSENISRPAYFKIATGLQEQIEQRERELELLRRKTKCSKCGMDYFRLSKKGKVHAICKTTTKRKWWKEHRKEAKDEYGILLFNKWENWKGEPHSYNVFYEIKMAALQDRIDEIRRRMSRGMEGC